MNVCAECGTPLQDGKRCRDYFDQMISWDFADFSGAGKVHHLTVLCYYLQHPSYYSQEGLQEAIRILKNAVDQNFTDKQLYKEESAVFSSSNRTWNVGGTEEDHASYPTKIHWTMTAADIIADGVEKYPRHVKDWAQSINRDLAKL